MWNDVKPLVSMLIIHHLNCMVNKMVYLCIIIIIVKESDFYKHTIITPVVEHIT